MAEKPTAAFVLSLIGGIFILLGAIVVMALASVIGSFMVLGGGDPNIVYIYGAVGLIFAVLFQPDAPSSGPAFSFLKLSSKTSYPVASSDFSENDPWPRRPPVTTRPALTRLRPGRLA